MADAPLKVRVKSVQQLGLEGENEEKKQGRWPRAQKLSRLRPSIRNYVVLSSIPLSTSSYHGFINSSGSCAGSRNVRCPACCRREHKRLPACLTQQDLFPTLIPIRACVQRTSTLRCKLQHLDERIHFHLGGRKRDIGSFWRVL